MLMHGMHVSLREEESMAIRARCRRVGIFGLASELCTDWTLTLVSALSYSCTVYCPHQMCMTV